MHIGRIVQFFNVRSLRANNLPIKQISLSNCMIASLASAGRRWSEAEAEDGTGQGTASGAGGR